MDILDQYIIESAISTVSVDDIQIEQMIAECDVCLSFIANYEKQLTIMESTDLSLSEFGYHIQEGAEPTKEEVVEKKENFVKRWASKAWALIKRLGEMITNFISGLFGSGKLEKMADKIETSDTFDVKDFEVEAFLNSISGFLVVYAVYAQLIDLMVVKKATGINAYKPLESVLDTLITSASGKAGAQSIYAFKDAISVLPSKDHELNKMLAGFADQLEKGDYKTALLNGLLIISKSESLKNSKQILKKVEYDEKEFANLYDDGETDKCIHNIATKISKCYNIYQKKSLDMITLISKRAGVAPSESEQAKITIQNKKAEDKKAAGKKPESEPAEPKKGIIGAVKDKVQEFKDNKTEKNSIPKPVKPGKVKKESYEDEDADPVL